MRALEAELAKYTQKPVEATQQNPSAAPPANADSAQNPHLLSLLVNLNGPESQPQAGGAAGSATSSSAAAAANSIERRTAADMMVNVMGSVHVPALGSPQRSTATATQKQQPPQSPTQTQASVILTRTVLAVFIAYS